uniref:Uncharacterized protein n=1 Tax=Arundo donax TaxID=35708 RepID=A0A0A9H6X7_ARUDO
MFPLVLTFGIKSLVSLCMFPHLETKPLSLWYTSGRSIRMIRIC